MKSVLQLTKKMLFSEGYMSHLKVLYYTMTSYLDNIEQKHCKSYSKILYWIILTFILGSCKKENIKITSDKTTKKWVQHLAKSHLIFGHN